MNRITENDVKKRLETEPEDNKTSESDLSTRRSICNGCDRKQQMFGVDYCGECKCVLLMLTAFRFTRCPLNKWEVEMPPDSNIPR